MSKTVMIESASTKQAKLKLQTTGITNLAVRSSTGIYYLRAKVNGKLFRSSLSTNDLEVAKQRLEKKMTELRVKAGKDCDLENAAKFEEAAMWRVFATQTMPQLVKQLARLNQQLEKLNRREERASATGPRTRSC